MTSIQIMLYTVGALSIIALLGALLDVYKRRTKHKR